MSSLEGANVVSRLRDRDPTMSPEAERRELLKLQAELVARAERAEAAKIRNDWWLFMGTLAMGGWLALLLPLPIAEVLVGLGIGFNVVRNVLRSEHLRDGPHASHGPAEPCTCWACR